MASVIKKEKEGFKEEGEKEISVEISKTTEKSTSNMLAYQITNPKDLIQIGNIIQNGSKLETSLLSLIYFGGEGVIDKKDHELYALNRTIQGYCRDYNYLWRPDIDPVKFLTHLIDSGSGNETIRQLKDTLVKNPNMRSLDEYIQKYLPTYPFSNQYVHNDVSGS